MSQSLPPLNVQYNLDHNFQSLFTEKNDPQLLYVCHIEPTASSYPRIMHRHDNLAEIVLIYSGKSEYLIHDHKQMIQAGDLVIYNSGIIHDEISSTNTQVGSYCVAISELHLPGLRENALVPDDYGYVFPTGKYFDSIQTLCQMMFQSLTSGEPHAEIYCQNLMRALLIRTLVILEENQPLDQPEIDEAHIMGTRIKNYIDQHYMEPLTMQDIGDALKINPYYMSHIFKDMSGYSPGQYLLRRRIGEAQTLLITTDLSILEISGRVGFDTQNYFNHQFTKNVGISPKKYRQNYIVSNHSSFEGWPTYTSYGKNSNSYFC